MLGNRIDDLDCERNGETGGVDGLLVISLQDAKGRLGDERGRDNREKQSCKTNIG
jgi:hypothetical protein